ncbi:hypothetical protein COCC4DRAFT_34442 [Bipolaris maydis ATCC 48331]|uniref:Uncharacterized protein n=2 Tax=Cochliobolus heterostrophus TaxID=5016 RepID=M2UGR9_COCH5|nr:uncharacterized protein COCC4DRAFT_34442 [Bipolaris maydis ATCC 48331]EMD87188.1 hypothetical protein COCHEDRAFT_1023435 [Bipolaris maydis C5]KAH7555144.1 hypothetical protein BM1_07805 [Bipolaris maydis]ENI00417.1 hypothetical protein COCC4DRAFT_34442 [Bipolaris maydis ATCC 48331]KAJ5022950.1 hypothetical protein J3E73DRAFT_335968 [Bipolaris maydis]KAJ5056308.1 hypothetical protein J3E74DRAFT_379347 [Bipolaris maydis]
MRYSFFALAAAGVLASAQSTIPLGENCTPGGTPCAGGANCYATNSMLQPRCGNFQSSCTSDAQCAFNTCNGGLCNGPKPSSAPVPSSTPPATTPIPLGEQCTPGGTPCANGANCYATNSMLQPRCGNFQSSCTSDAQCAYNTCNGGFCSGPKASSSTPPTVTSSAAPGWSPAPSPTISAPAGSLALGAECNPYVTPSQCMAGVECWASNAGLIAKCGNFNAACKTDAQCAYNTCNNGICNGLRMSSSGLPVASSTPVPGTLSVQPTPSSGSSGNGTVHPSHTPSTTSSGTPEFTGAASAEKVAGGIFAIVFGAIAMGL